MSIDPLTEHFVTKAEVAGMFGMIRDHLKRQDEVLEEIKTQATQTNGRVRTVELWKARIEGGRAMAGSFGTTALAIFSSAIGGLIVYLLSN